jgi:2-iminobutanoate/2-iminopropanoate deaminase
MFTLDTPAGVPAPPGGRYSHVARLDLPGGALLVLAGQVALDDAGALIAPDDMTAQAEHVFDVIEGILAAHGGTLADVMHVRTFLTDLGDLPAYGAVRRRRFPGVPPASTTVEVSRLFVAGAVLEVEVTAAVRTAV